MKCDACGAPVENGKCTYCGKTFDDNQPKEIKIEATNAVNEKAKSYSDVMHMSKKAIYNQLVSEYGEQYTKDEAQYAIDNLE